MTNCNCTDKCGCDAGNTSKSDLEQLLELYDELNNNAGYFLHYYEEVNEEFESLKSKLEQQLEKAKRFDELSKEGVIYQLRDGYTEFDYIRSIDLADARDELIKENQKLKAVIDEIKEIQCSTKAGFEVGRILCQIFAKLEAQK